MQPLVQFLSYDSPEDVGGVSSWLRKTLPWLRAQGIDARVDLFCFGGQPGVNAEWYRKNNVPFRWSPWREHTEDAVQQCLFWLHQEFPRIYVPSCILPAYFAAAEARRCGARTLGILHSDDSFYGGLVDEFVQGSVEWRLDEVVVVSRYLHESLQSVTGPAIPVHEIPYGVTIPQGSALPPSEKLRIIYTGRLVEEQKRVSDLARALCRVAREHSDVEAWIVGAGSAEAGVRNIIRAAGMDHKVVLKGRINHESIYDVLRECHVFVLLSDYEGTPVSLLEAMSVGLVPICLETRSGVGEVIKHMENGLLVRDREDSFSSAVSYLVENPGAWLALSSAARQTITERYSDQSCLDKWKALLSADPTSVPPGRRPRSHLHLPAPNPKFGHYDQRRPGKVRRVWNRFRHLTGSARRQALAMRPTVSR